MIATRPPELPTRLRRLHRRARQALAWVREQELPDLTGRLWLDALLLTGVGLVLLGLGAAVALYGYISRDLPAPEQVFSAGMFQTAMIYDRKGRLLYELIDPQGGRRSVITLSQMPRSLIDATVMTEDPSFSTNPGLDLKAVLRAFLADLTHGRVVSGASTITQQLVRNVVMTPEERRSQSLSRKIGEAILAVRVSERYSKDQILERYLNEIYYGNLAYGVEAASETYFDKPVQQLDLAQAALIAGLPQAPALYDPYQHPQAAKQRQLEVLGLMVKHGAITQAQADAAAAEPLVYHAARAPLEAPYFVMYARNLLQERYSRQQIYESGLRIYTTLDLDLQHRAEAIVRAHLPDLQKNGASDAGLVAIDPTTGEVLAYVGGAQFGDGAAGGQLDAATAPREPGSTIKTFTYLYAFDHGVAAPGSILPDSPRQYPMGNGQPPYVPKDDDGQFRGPVSARRALASSYTVPAVALLDEVGVNPVLTLLRRLGLATLDQPASYYGLSLTVGSAPASLLDLTYAYATLANGGLQVGVPAPAPTGGSTGLAPATFLRVTDARGNVLDGYQPGTSGGAMRLASPQAAWLVTDVLADEAARAGRFGAHTALELPDRPAAAKGATSDDLRDTWTIGYTPRLVVGVWVGNVDGTPVHQAFALQGAAVIWHDFMEAALAGQPPEPFARPPGLVRVTTDGVTDWASQATLPPDSTPADAAAPTPTAAPNSAPVQPAAGAGRPAPAPAPRASGHVAPKHGHR